jgi:UDP-galactose transporter
LKILTTAIFSVVLLRRHLDFSKWLSLLVLVAGVSLVQLSGMKSGAEAAKVTTGNMTIGLLAVVLACCSSGFAGVYFEKVLKGSEISVWVRNVELALIGIVVGLAGVWYTDADLVGQHGFFYGYSPLVWSVIALQALGGIVVALVVKHADSLLKGFSTAISIVISCLVSYLFFGEVELSPKFVMGVALVICSTIMYSVNPIELCCPGTAPMKSLGSRGLLPTMGYGGKHDGKLERIPLTEMLHDDGSDSDMESTSSGADQEHIEEAISDGSRGGFAHARGQPFRRSLPT